MKVLFSFVLLLLFSLPAFASDTERDELKNAIVKEKFFRQSIGILWSYIGEDTRSYVAQVRYGLLADELLPNAFSQLGLVPTAVVSDIAYESNPASEDGDAIWTKVTVHYDNLFSVELLEGRAIYNDILLDSYLGAGFGLNLFPIDEKADGWIGAYYLGSGGFKLYAECVYEVTDDFWPYFIYEYYIDDEETNEGEFGMRYKDIYLKAENRQSEWIYAVGVTLVIE